MSLRIYKESSKFLICFCPQHRDENNANFVINKCWHNGKPKGFGFCFACGYHTEYSSEFVDSMSSQLASKKETPRFREQIPVDWHKLTTDFIDGEGVENIKLAKKWDINPHTLFQYYVGWITGAYSIPMRDENQVIIGIQLRYETGDKCCLEGSRLGLFIPMITLDRQVIITEGFSDSAIATDLGFFGIGRPSAQAGNDLVLDFLSLNNVKDVTIVADNDQSEIGEKSARKLGDLLEQNGVKTRMIIPEGAKDLRNYFQINGREQTTDFLERKLK